MRLKVSRADPGICHLILNRYCCQRTPPPLKFLTDLADILSVGSSGGTLFIL